MKNIAILFALLLLNCKSQPKEVESTQTSAKEVENKAQYATCIARRVALFKEKTQCKTGSAVTSYLFQNELVYVFSEGTCGADMQALVYNTDCIKLGALGGFTGNTKINGVNFSEAVYQAVIWKQNK